MRRADTILLARAFRSFGDSPLTAAAGEAPFLALTAFVPGMQTIGNTLDTYQWTDVTTDVAAFLGNGLVQAGFVAGGRRFIADGITSVVRTMLTPAELARHLPLAKASDKTPPTKVKVANLAGQCTLCGACIGCPRGVAIQDILRTYQYYACDLGWMDEAVRQYEAIPVERLASACSGCGLCEQICPQNLPVRMLIGEAHGELATGLARA